MKKYFFYSLTGSGVVSLQFPNTADSFGVIKSGKIYQIKTTLGASFTSISEGDEISETSLLAAIDNDFPDAQVMAESVDNKVTTMLTVV
jgi:hypothetical protein